MFGFLKNGKIYKELDEIIAQIDSNVANNYKDAAQEAVECLERKINEFWENGQLSEKKKLEYSARLTRYKRELEGFTHKDQKPYWSQCVFKIFKCGRMYGEGKP